MEKKTNSFVLLILLIFIISCDSIPNRLTVNVDDIEIKQVKIHRYAKALFSIDTSNLQAELKKLQPQFPVFLDGDLDDSYSLNSMRGFITDTFLIRVQHDVETVYPNLSSIENELNKAFKYYKYYYPNARLPEVFTYVSGFDYEHKIQVYNQNLLIALDMYLGEDYPNYKQLGLAHYVFKKFSQEYLIKDCVHELASSYIDHRKVQSALLDLMITEGKKLWFTHALIPEMDAGILFGYTEEQLLWVKNNEAMVWAFIIENEMLYSTDPIARQKFIIDAPFTSFFGNESPARLGSWIGYQIVNSFMQTNNNTSFPELMNNYEFQKILKRSGFKPKI